MLRRWVYEGSFNDLGIQDVSAVYGRFKVLDLEPQDDAVCDRCCSCVDKIWVIFLVLRVQLKQ